MARSLPRMLHDLRQQLLFLSSNVEDAIAKVVTALLNRDGRLAREVIAADTEIDNLEMQIEAACEEILVLQGPVACDMRFVVTTLKMNSYLERMGDLTKKIGKSVVYLCGVPPETVPIDFREMAEAARSMVKRSMDAFINGDVRLARQVVNDDDAIDKLKDELNDQLLSNVPKDADQLKVLLKLYSVVRNLERLGDMATHVAEVVIFMVDGDIVRHFPGKAAAG